MFALRATTGFFVVLLVLVTATSSAQVPNVISFQGLLTDPVSGAPADTTVDITTKLYQGGVEVFNQLHSGVVVDSGLFNLDIGPLNGVSFDRPTEVGITVDTDAEMTPRTPLQAAPYSLGLKLPFESRGTASVNSGLINLSVDGGGAAVQVDSSAGPGITVGYTATHGIEVLEATSNGIHIGNAHGVGLRVDDTDSYGVQIHNPATDGLRIDDAGDDAIDIQHANGNGLFIGLVGDPASGIFTSEPDGVEIVGAEGNGVAVGYAGNDGLHVANAFRNGIRISNAGNRGVLVDTAGQAGFDVTKSGSPWPAFRVESAGNPSGWRSRDIYEGPGFEVLGSEGDGVFVGRADHRGFKVISSGSSGFSADTTYGYGVYIGLSAQDAIYVGQTFGYAANLRASKNAASTIANHVALVHNTSSSTTQGPDILALKTQAISPNTGSNFITFFNGNNASLGSIEGNGGGVQLGSAGSDYAEFLPLADGEQAVGPGDVVGVFGGRISRRTAGADQVMAITDQAIVVGNSPGEDEVREGFETVSFIGQVPVRVVGPARSGEFLVPSGNDDGTAIALSPDQVSIGQLSSIVGQVWEDNLDPGVKRVNTAVGLDNSAVLMAIVERQQRDIEELLSLVRSTSEAAVGTR